MWIIGVDEAGYGPNLGPFVMTAVAFRVPHDECDLWDVLRSAVRRDSEPDDSRILIADSKIVHSGPNKLMRLEQAVHATLPDEKKPTSLHTLIEQRYPTSCEALRSECWYKGETVLPVEESENTSSVCASFPQACAGAAVTCSLIRGVLICAEQFNALVAAHGSKGAVLRHGLTELIRAAWTISGDESLCFFVDKHGGRNAYAPQLQDAVPEGMVVAHQESNARSVYGVRGASRPVRFTFQPRADAEHFTVALASMVSKYVREILMREFNEFWLSQVPDLKPTAGYPLDARRFYEAIQPAMTRLGIAESAVWRAR
jgi:ribonuclease HII